MAAFTTFSTFSLETALLYERGETVQAIAYVVASVALSLAGLAGAMLLVRLGLYSHG